jgi:molecular chaperone DnaK (HSP70)
MEYMLKQFEKKTGKDARKDKRALQKLRREVERAKIAVSSAHQARIEIENFHDGADLMETLTRAKFEVRSSACFLLDLPTMSADDERLQELNMDLFKKILPPMSKVLEDAKLKKSDIHEIVLVGGSSRIPKIQQMVKVVSLRILLLLFPTRQN